jgi:hypothetical protein
MHIRDERQMQAFTGLSHAQFNHLLPVCSDLAQATPQQTSAKGIEAGTRSRQPGGGCQGKLRTMADTLRCVLSYYQTSPTCEALGTPLAMARSQAHEHLHKLSPILDAPLGSLALMPYRAWATPADGKAALPGVDRLLMEATERASHRSTDDAQQRAHDRGKQTSRR